MPYFCQQPLVERAGVDADPDRHAGVADAACAISLTLSSNCRMLPGLTRTAAQPASIAAKTYLGWKWMSAITGICDFLAIAGSASTSSCDGTATRTIWQPDAVSSAICCRVALTSAVRVVVIDCTRHRRAAADRHGADHDLAALPARGERRRRHGGHAEADRGHGSTHLGKSVIGLTMSAVIVSSVNAPTIRITA